MIKRTIFKAAAVTVGLAAAIPLLPANAAETSQSITAQALTVYPPQFPLPAPMPGPIVPKPQPWPCPHGWSTTPGWLGGLPDGLALPPSVWPGDDCPSWPPVI